MKTDRTTLTINLPELRGEFLLGPEVDMAEAFFMSPGSDNFAVSWAENHYGSETVKILSRTTKPPVSRSGDITYASVQLIRDPSRIDYSRFDEDEERRIGQDHITVGEISGHDYHIFVDARRYPQFELVPVAVDRLTEFLIQDESFGDVISLASYDRLRASLNS